MQGYCDVYKWTILKRTSPEVKCLHPTSSRRGMCTLSVSNVIYHQFSHGAVFYTLNGKNVNVMLELQITNNIVTSDKGVKSPSLGRTWSHVPNVRILIGQYNDDPEQSVRIAKIVKNSRGVRIRG